MAKMTATGRLHCDVFGSLSSSKMGNRKKRATLDDSRSSSMVLSSRDSSGKRQQEMIDLLLDLDPA